MQGILRGHGAGIRIASLPGQGSTFSLFFPALAGAVPAAAAAAPEGAEGPFHGRVLLVDDEPDVLAATAAMLEATGLEVVTAEDGLDALERFRLDRDGFALVLLDLSMPRLDGFETFRELRALRPGLPVILYSGYTEHGSLREALAQGQAGLLEKPFQLAELRQAIRKVAGLA